MPTMQVRNTENHILIFHRSGVTNVGYNILYRRLTNKFAVRLMILEFRHSSVDMRPMTCNELCGNMSRTVMSHFCWF